MLQAHIFNFYSYKRAVAHRFVKRRAGVIGMHVDLDDLVIIHQYQAVAQLIEEGPQCFRVFVVFTGDDKLRAVGEGDILGVKVAEVCLLLNLLLLQVGGHLDVLIVDSGHHTFQHQQPALAAGIHHTGLFQHRVLIDRVGKCDLCLVNGGLMDCLEALILFRHLGGLCGGQAGNRQNCTLGRLHNRLVCGIHAFLQGGCPQHTVTALVAL